VARWTRPSPPAGAAPEGSAPIAASRTRGPLWLRRPPRSRRPSEPSIAPVNNLGPTRRREDAGQTEQVGGRSDDLAALAHPFATRSAIARPRWTFVTSSGRHCRPTGAVAATFLSLYRGSAVAVMRTPIVTGDADDVSSALAPCVSADAQDDDSSSRTGGYEDDGEFFWPRRTSSQVPSAGPACGR
jgi:hypothetical protein